MCKTFTSEPSQVATSPHEMTATREVEKPATTQSKNQQWSGMNAAVASHPVTLEAFYCKHPSFLWGPLLVAAFLYATTTHIPAVVDYLRAQEMTQFGWTSAWQYTAFAVIASYAFHGFCTTHAPHQLKVQAAYDYQVKPDAMAIRSTAALLTSLIYTFMPFAPSTFVWWQFAAWTAALSVYWDAHFYAAHRFCHENKTAYRFFHKTHHLCKEPNCFGAYFVTYQSHIVLEQLVVAMFAAAGMPRNVFLFTLYWGTIGAFVEHSGFELGDMKLPLIPMTFGQLCSLMGASTSWLLDGTYCLALACVCACVCSCGIRGIGASVHLCICGSLVASVCLLTRLVISFIP
jgi:hypothetical protein